MSFFNTIAASGRGIIVSTTPIIANFLADVYGIPGYGQSLAINTSAGGSTYLSTEPLSYDKNLTNTNIQDMAAGVAEAFSLMAVEDGVSLPANFKIINTVDGGGGLSVSQLSKGSSYYTSLLNSVTTAKTSCDNAGLTFNVPCFTWTQGEENMRAGGVPSSYGTGTFDPITYTTQLIQLIDDINTDIKAITGQSNDVLCISYQVASHNAYSRYPRIAMQQDLTAKNDSRMVLAKAMYDVEYNTDEVHAPAKTYRYMGNMYGVAAWRETVMNQSNKHLRPISQVVNGTEVTITFDVPVSPLVLDTTLVNQLADGNYGFNILNVSGEDSGVSGTIEEATTRITNVSLSGTDKVVLTCSRTPVAGERITYAINGVGWNDLSGVYDSGGKSGRIDGARGCLRDSQPIKNNNSGSVFTDLYNWSVIFEIKI